MLSIGHIKLATYFLSIEQYFLEVFLAQNFNLYFLKLLAKCFRQGIFWKVLIANRYICITDSPIRLKQELSPLYIIMGK